MARIAVGIEYHGGAYHGWQSQTGAVSIQAEVQRALSAVANHPVQLTCAGRTDAGVHALGQVAHFDTSAERAEVAWVLGANVALPADISIRWARVVPEQFHARFSARARTYRYLILNRRTRSALTAGRALTVHRPLNAVSMSEAAALLVGEHDFSAFRAAECQARNPVRELRALRVKREGEWLVVEATANAFLHHMVRNMVGLLLAVGRGDVRVQRAADQLASRDRASGEATAPAHGLYFWNVQYPSGFGLDTDSAMIAATMDLEGLAGSGN
jgi:tRNA pseudouridine38-40 synthase